MTACRVLLAILVMLSAVAAQAQQFSPALPPGRSVADGFPRPELPQPPAVAPPGTPLGQAGNPYGQVPLGMTPRHEDWATAPAAACVSPQVLAACTERPVESTWYTRIEYFHWNERLDGADFVNEYGPWVTLGYTRRIGVERFRIELFGGTVDYAGAGMFDDGTTEPLYSKTAYLGVRGEYDLLIEPTWWPRMVLSLGIGTRFWIRDLWDGVTVYGSDVLGYQETWWTIYPYLGLETKRQVVDGVEFYGAGRIGFTAITYQHASAFDAALYPSPGLIGQLEGGLRGRCLHLAAFCEVMNWGESPIVRDTLQPSSTLVTVGLKTGLSF